MKSDLIYPILIMKMTEYFEGDPKRIQHFLKVYALTATIAQMEKVGADTLHTLKIASILHDIGIKTCEEKYGHASGELQEEEGILPAREMMSDLGLATETTDRVCWLIAHHHTYDDISDLDHRILIEADFLVNMFEDNMEEEQIRSTYTGIFRTQSGRTLCRHMFSIAESDMQNDPQNTAASTSASSPGHIFRAANITPEYMVSDKCNGCGTCVDVCPVQCIDNRRTPVYIRQEDCIHCGSCASVCFKNAIIHIAVSS